MTSTRRALAVTLAAALLSLPGAAQASFGKRSDSGGSSSNSGSGSGGSSGSGSHNSSAPSYHPAVPAGTPSSPNYGGGSPGYGGHHPVGGPRPVYYPAGMWPYAYGWGAYYDPYYAPYYGPYPYPYPPPPGTAPMQVEQQAPPLLSTFSFGGSMYHQGASLGLGLAIEGVHWGMNADFSAIFTRDQDMVALDSLKTADVHLTYAILSGERGRLRLEGGIGGVVAPDLAVLGPDVGASALVSIVGPLGVEAAAHTTPWPHFKLDGSAGLALGLGPVGLKAGWKVLYLNDRNLLGEGANSDFFSGPYASVGLVF